MQRAHRVVRIGFKSVVMMALPALVGFLLAQIRVMGVLSPFAAAYCAMLLSSGRAGVYAALGCALGLPFGHGIAAVTTAWTAAGLTLCHMVACLSGYRISNRLHAGLFVLLLAGSVWASRQTPYALMHALLNGALALVFYWVFQKAMEGLRVARDKRPLSAVQSLSLGTFVCVLLMSTGGLTLMTLNFMHILLAAMVMLLALCLPAPICACFGIVVGCFAALSGTASIQIVSNVGLCALCSGICARLGKFGALCGFLLANALFALYFAFSAPSLHLGEALLAAFAVACIPQRFIDMLDALLCHPAGHESAAHSDMASVSTAKRIRSVADALDKTASVMRGKGKGGASIPKAALYQLNIAAKKLHKTANSVQKEGDFHEQMERQLLHCLRMEGLEPLEAAVHKDEGGITVRLEMRACGAKAFCLNPICKYVSAACGLPMKLEGEPCKRKRRKKCTLHYKNAQRIVLSGGVASARRRDAKVSGDVVSSCKLSGGRELICLCDGMGSGEKARDAAKMAADLIEGFFQADYAQEEILAAVNSLLSLRKSEVFAAVDLLLVDTLRMKAQFIKTAAGPSFLLRGAKMAVIEMGALPMGVLESVRPAVVQKRIRPGDCIVMLSDGVADALEGEDAQQWLTQALTQPDQSRAANALLERARRKLGKWHDDMTVVVLRVERERP